MKLKNKMFLIFFLLLFFILFLNINKCFASASDLNVISYSDDIVSSLRSLEEYISGEYWYMVVDSSNDVEIALFLKKSENPGLKSYISKEPSLYLMERYAYSTFFNYTGSRPGIAYYYDSYTKSFTNREECDIASYYYNFALKNHVDICYATNLTVYTDDTYTTVFFQFPVTEVVIPALETAEQIPEAITKTLKIVIPVGLIVLAIGLVIYLIKRVTYLVH